MRPAVWCGFEIGRLSCGMVMIFPSRVPPLLRPPPAADPYGEHATAEQLNQFFINVRLLSKLLAAQPIFQNCAHPSLPGTFRCVSNMMPLLHRRASILSPCSAANARVELCLAETRRREDIVKVHRDIVSLDIHGMRSDTSRPTFDHRQRQP